MRLLRELGRSDYTTRVQYIPFYSFLKESLGFGFELGLGLELELGLQRCIVYDRSST